MIYSLFDYHFPNTTMYSSVGNHDTYPIDQTIPDIYKYMINQLSDNWSKWLPNSNNTFKDYGYYSHEMNNKLQLISFNSIYYDSHNFFKIDSDEADLKTGNQIKWLENEFYLASKMNKKILFINHIPLMGGESTPYYNSKLLEIIQKYSKNILVQLNGHEHSDHFYLYQNKSQIYHHALIPNSIVTSNNFPGFRIIIYDKDTNIFKNYKQFTCNLTKIIKDNKFSCNLLYDFNELYNVKDMSLESYKIVYNKLSTNLTLLNKYIEYKDYGNSNINYCQDKSCIESVLNSIKN